GPLCLVASGADWPQFLGPARNGTSSETGLRTSWPKAGPPVLWQRAVGEGFSGPVVAGGRLIVVHRVGDNDVVECLDAASGQERWRSEPPTTYQDRYGRGNGPRSTPLIAGNHVFTLGADGHLLCLDLDNGRKVWERSLLSEYRAEPGFFGVATSPLL